MLDAATSMSGANDRGSKFDAEEYMRKANLEGIPAGPNGIEIPKELLEQEPLEKINAEQIEKGLVRLKFKHPL